MLACKVSCHHPHRQMQHSSSGRYHRKLWRPHRRAHRLGLLMWKRKHSLHKAGTSRCWPCRQRLLRWHMLASKVKCHTLRRCHHHGRQMQPSSSNRCHPILPRPHRQACRPGLCALCSIRRGKQRLCKAAISRYRPCRHLLQRHMQATKLCRNTVCRCIPRVQHMQPSSSSQQRCHVLQRPHRQGYRLRRRTLYGTFRCKRSLRTTGSAATSRCLRRHLLQSWIMQAFRLHCSTPSRRMILHMQPSSSTGEHCCHKP